MFFAAFCFVILIMCIRCDESNDCHNFDKKETSLMIKQGRTTILKQWAPFMDL